MQAEGIRIMVLDRGRVKVGHLTRHPDLAFHWLLKGARIIRRWGSSQGLEEIAQNGPTNETVLDTPCHSIVPFRAVIEILDTTELKWLPHLSLSESSSAPPKRTPTQR